MTDEMYLATKADFDDAIAATNGGKPLIIDFTASWCPPLQDDCPKIPGARQWELWSHF